MSGILCAEANHHARANCREHDGEGSRTTRALAFSTLRRHRVQDDIENRSFVAGSLSAENDLVVRDASKLTAGSQHLFASCEIAVQVPEQPLVIELQPPDPALPDNLPWPVALSSPRLTLPRTTPSISLHDQLWWQFRLGRLHPVYSWWAKLSIGQRHTGGPGTGALASSYHLLRPKARRMGHQRELHPGKHSIRTTRMANF